MRISFFLGIFLTVGLKYDKWQNNISILVFLLKGYSLNIRKLHSIYVPAHSQILSITVWVYVIHNTYCKNGYEAKNAEICFKWTAIREKT